MLRAEQQDHALDLAPAAEIDRIAEIAIAIRTRRGLEARIDPEAIDQVGGAVHRRPIGDIEELFHAIPHFLAPGTSPIIIRAKAAKWRERRPFIVTAAFAKSLSGIRGAGTGRLVHPMREWHGAAMSQQPAPRAAGAVIAFTVIAGALIGTLVGQPSLGTVIGFGAGAAIAVGMWLLDRR